MPLEAPVIKMFRDVASQDAADEKESPIPFCCSAVLLFLAILTMALDKRRRYELSDCLIGAALTR
jgi:hypothetical protein